MVTIIDKTAIMTISSTKVKPFLFILLPPFLKTFLIAYIHNKSHGLGPRPKPWLYFLNYS